MRRPALLLSLLASLSLVLTPFGMLHAHIDNNHEQVFVHGGHSHDLDLHQDHQAQGTVQSCCEYSDVDGFVHPDFDHSTVVHVVQLDSAADQATQHPIKFGKVISGSNKRPPDPPHHVTSIQHFPSSDRGFFRYRTYLHPPLRGPPAAFPQAI